MAEQDAGREWPQPQLDEPWEKREFSNSPGQYYLYVPGPGMDWVATWPMREDIIDRILADHRFAAVARDLIKQVENGRVPIESELDRAFNDGLSQVLEWYRRLNDNALASLTENTGGE